MEVLITASHLKNDDSLNYGVHHLVYDPSTFSLFSGVSKIGVCKWLFYSESLMQPELSYVYPLT